MAAPPVLTAPSALTANSLQTELDRVFPRQTNIQFSVIGGGGFSYNYDLDKDGAIHYDVLPDGKECYACIVPGELSGLLTGSGGFFFDPVHVGWTTDPANFFAFYVNKISRKDVLGFSAHGQPNDPAIVATVPDLGTSAVANLTENVTAHEMGHILGDGHSNRGTKFLMTPKNPNTTPLPCRISRDDWNIMNFTKGIQ